VAHMGRIEGGHLPRSAVPRVARVHSRRSGRNAPQGVRCAVPDAWRPSDGSPQWARVPLLLQSFADSATGTDTASIAANRTSQIDAHHRVSVCARPATFRLRAAVAGGGTGRPALPTFRWLRRLLFGDPFTARHPRPERGACAEAGRTYTNPLSGLPVKPIGRTCRPA